MQVNRGSFDPDKSMEAAVKLLKEYFRILKSQKATIIAYNCGIGNYLKGNYRLEYWYKYVKGKSMVESRVQSEIPLGSTIPVEGDRDGLHSDDDLRPVLAVHRVPDSGDIPERDFLDHQ